MNKISILLKLKIIQMVRRTDPKCSKPLEITYCIRGFFFADISDVYLNCHLRINKKNNLPTEG